MASLTNNHRSGLCDWGGGGGGGERGVRRLRSSVGRLRGEFKSDFNPGGAVRSPGGAGSNQGRFFFAVLPSQLLCRLVCALTPLVCILQHART